MQNEHNNALNGDTDLDKKIVKLFELNELYEDLILWIITSSSVGKVTFGLVRNVKSADFLEGNSKIAWNRLVSNYASHAAFSWLKLESELHNGKFELIEKDPDEWISNLSELRIYRGKFGLKLV